MMIPPDCRELIHTLNQRYREEWDRAERLQAELDDIQGSRGWRLFNWLRRLRRRLLPPSPLGDPRPGVMGGAMRTDHLAVALQSVSAQPIPHTAQVSLIIPFKDQLGLLRNCLRSLGRSTYRRLEIILVDNGSAGVRMRRYLEFLRGRRGFRVLSCPGPFNFAHLCNQGARSARGDYLLFLNNDIEVQTPDWLERMLDVAEQPRVGIVGATLLYPDGGIQHAGMEPLPNGTWRHIERGVRLETARAELHTVRCVPAVTGACLLMRRDRFHDLGCFREYYAVTYNDVDLCLRAREHGWLVAITPHARLVHFESLSRGYARPAWE